MLFDLIVVLIIRGSLEMASHRNAENPWMICTILIRKKLIDANVFHGLIHSYILDWVNKW